MEDPSVSSPKASGGGEPGPLLQSSPHLSGEHGAQPAATAAPSVLSLRHETRVSDEGPQSANGRLSGCAMGNVNLSFRHIFGMKTDVKRAVHYAEADVVVYPAGHHVVLYTCSTKNQRFLTGAEEATGSTCLAMSINRRFLAVGEQCSQRALVTIYDLLTNKRRKSLAFIDCLSEAFVSVAFSTDSKMLLALGGPPDWCLVSWAWEKPKVVATCKLSAIKDLRFCDCSFHPLDSNILCIIGDGVSRWLKFQDGSLRILQNHLLKREGPSYTSHAWLENANLIAGTESGELLLFDSSGDFKSSLACAPGVARSILCIESTSKGFICGGGDAAIHMYERIEDEQVYRKTMELKVEHQSAGASVTSVAVAPHEEALCVCLSNGQLFQISLKAPATKRKEEIPAIDYLHTAFHVGPILGMDVCELKPLVVTCGADKSIRVWNFMENSLELCKFYAEEVYSVAFHPSGYHILAGFSDKLRLLNLLHEDLNTIKEYLIKGCRECRFSNGGHLFAAAHSNLIQVYETYTNRSLVTLRGHNSKVRSLYWTQDDSILVSAGMDGAVYEYKVCKECIRLTDWVQKGVNLSGVLAYKTEDSQQNTMLVVGNDNTLKEVSNSLLMNEYEAGATLSCLAMPKKSSVLFVGTADPRCPGQVRCYAFPLTGEYLRYHCHATGVQRICVSKDDALVISCGQDGTLCICGLTDKARIVDEEELVGHEYSDEVLVTRGYMRDKQAQLTELERQVDDLTNQLEFQLRNRETQHREQLLQVEERYNYQLEQERRKYEILREEKQEQEQLFTEHEKEREERYASSLQQMETNFQNKMAIEVARYHKVVSEREKDKKEAESRMQQATEEFTLKMAKATKDFEEAQRKATEEIESLQQEKDLALKTHQELLRQIEEDADREIEELKEMYETKLAQESAEKVRLRGQAGIHRKRHEDLKEQMELLREELKQKDEAAQRFRSDLEKLFSDREAVLKELQERDRTIGEKEQRIYELKKHNQELEKFKFVLDHKIRELKGTIDPKNKHISEMQKQIQAMDAELVDYHRQHKLSTLEVAQLKLKQRALQDEIVEQRQKLAICAHQAGRMKTDLYDCAQHLQDPKQLKGSITRLYQKYIINGSTGNGDGTRRRKAHDDVDVDILKELHRQRDYLEKSVESLKHRLAKDAEVHRQDNMKLMQENASLICEINDLRREVNTLRVERQEARVQGALHAESEAQSTIRKGNKIHKINKKGESSETAGARAAGAQQKRTLMVPNTAKSSYPQSDTPTMGETGDEGDMRNLPQELSPRQRGALESAEKGFAVSSTSITATPKPPELGPSSGTSRMKSPKDSKRGKPLHVRNREDEVDSQSVLKSACQNPQTSGLQEAHDQQGSSEEIHPLREQQEQVAARSHSGSVCEVAQPSGREESQFSTEKSREDNDLSAQSESRVQIDEEQQEQLPAETFQRPQSGAGAAEEREANLPKCARKRYGEAYNRELAETALQKEHRGSHMKRRCCVLSSI